LKALSGHGLAKIVMREVQMRRPWFIVSIFLLLTLPLLTTILQVARNKGLASIYPSPIRGSNCPPAHRYTTKVTN
jgi:hypothetical protein